MNQHVSISYEETLKAEARERRLRLVGKPKVVNITQEQATCKATLGRGRPRKERIEFSVSCSFSVEMAGEAPCPEIEAVTFPTERITMLSVAQRVLANYHGITIEDIKNNRRHKYLILPRHHVTHAIKVTMPHVSFPQVGRWMGVRNHTTSLYSFNKVQSMIDAGTLEAEIDEWYRLYCTAGQR